MELVAGSEVARTRTYSRLCRMRMMIRMKRCLVCRAVVVARATCTILEEPM